MWYQAILKSLIWAQNEFFFKLNLAQHDEKMAEVVFLQISEVSGTHLKGF